MNSIVFTQFDDGLPVDENKVYYVSLSTQDTGLQEIHKLCLFPSKLREYLQVELRGNLNNILNATTLKKWTPLMIATKNGITESVKILIENKVNINFQPEDGWTALMLTYRLCNIECVKLLLEYGANINLQNKDGWTALMLVCRYYNNIEFVKLLLEYGANINLQQQNRWTALMLACRYCNTDSNIQCVKLLLEHKANINLQNKYGDTALMIACKNCNTDSSIQCVKLLLEHYKLTSQEIDLKSLIDNKLLTKDLYPIFIPYLIHIEDNDVLKLLPVDLLLKLYNIKNNIIKQSNKLKEFDLNSIILYEMKKVL